MRRNSRKKNNNKIFHSTQNIRYLFILVLVLILVFATIYLISNLKKDISDESANFSSENSFTVAENTNNTLTETSSTDSSKDVSFSLTAIGDVMCHNTQFWDAYNSSTGEYDFSYVFENIKYYTQTADITVGSLETSFAGAERGYSNYPIFNTPDALAYALKGIGVDVLSTAGNHCLDMGFSGLSRTIDVLDKADISHLGTYKSQEERDTILIKYVKGVKIAFIDYTYGTNGIPVPSGKDYCVNLINKDLISSDIERAKQLNPDIICACMHWGTEYRLTANDTQMDLSDFLFENGVDIILGNHPHVLEPMEKKTVTLKDGTKKDCFVIYALGNFICDQNAANTLNSIILNLNITKHYSGGITIDSVTYTPINMYKNTSVSIKKFKVLDIKKSIENYENGIDKSIGQAKYNDLKIQLEKIKSIVGEEIK